METFVGAVLALVIAFVYSWIITLVVLVALPIMLLFVSLSSKAVIFNAQSRKKRFEQAGKLSVESIENIRTVASLAVEDNFFAQYKTEVKKPYRCVCLSLSKMDGGGSEREGEKREREREREREGERFSVHVTAELIIQSDL